MCISHAAHHFYAELVQERAWWEAHRHRYQRDVEGPLRAFLDRASAEFDGEPRLFRPHRDVRFSADKSPYRTEALGGLGEPDDPAVLYVRVDAAGTVVGAGAPMPTRAPLAAHRRAIIDSDLAADALQAALENLSTSGFGLPDEPLRTAPRGVSRDHARIELLRRTRFTAERHFPPGALADPSTCDALILGTWREATPLIDWLRANAAEATERTIR